MATSTPTPVFSFHDHQIRTTVIDSQPWFAAKDICAALGIDWSGKTLTSIPDDWQSMGKLPTDRRGLRYIKIISEPGLYKLAFRSNKPEADAFTNWVASEVLPAIRKTGKYEPKPRQKALPETMPAPAPALKYPVHDFEQAIDVNRIISRKATKMGLDCYEQLKTWADEAEEAFCHSKRRHGVMDHVDFVVNEQGHALKRQAAVICEAMLAFSHHCTSMAYLAQLMRYQEKLRS